MKGVAVHHAQEAVGELLDLLGVPLSQDTLDTPRRVVAALREMTQGYDQDPADLLTATFDNGGYDEVVVCSDIAFTSLCEHHLLPFVGTAAVGYLPTDRVVGLSKLARLVDLYARRLQLQERMTVQIADAMQTHLEPRGVAVVVRAQHSCLACRGARKPDAQLVTSTMYGVFRDKPEARAEFLSLV